MNYESLKEKVFAEMDGSLTENKKLKA